MPPAKSDPIIIVGAGVFGLSTALHLAQRGYSHVTVFDKQPYDASRYAYTRGADAASADINKIVRVAYGGEVVYQSLALEAVAGWRAWNEEIANATEDGSLPPGMTREDRVFVNCGELAMTDTPTLAPFERQSVANMEAAGHAEALLVVGDAAHEAVAARRGIAAAVLDPFGRRARGKAFAATLDTTGGVAVADLACWFALHKARRLGVRFVLGAAAGQLTRLVHGDDDDDNGVVTGIVTQDGQTHSAALTILACGGWTPTLLPALDGVCEATGGTVAVYEIPRDSALWDRLAPERFPAWVWNMRAGAEGGLYGFPRDAQGRFKIGYRGTKYTNPRRQADGQERSVPRTRWSAETRDGQAPLTAVPAPALQVIRGFLDEYLPELRAAGITRPAWTRLCWYTDSFDNHLVVDYVPGTQQSLFVATAGSGHAFKYLPVLGRWVVDIMEGTGLERPTARAWRWRGPNEDGAAARVNALMEGSGSARALGNVALEGDGAKL